MDPNKNFSFLSFDGKFSERLECEYFKKIGNTFQKTISASHTHFWDPNNDKYIDFTIPFDIKNMAIMPFETVPELCCELRNELSEEMQIHFANDSLHWWLSGFLYGEQGALSLSLRLGEMVGNPDAVEYSANQAREEARHVTAFTNYINARWGAPMEVSPAFKKLLCKIIDSKKIHRKILGMQVLVEGLAMGFMASLYNKASDPVLRRLAQLVMTDETFHHKAGNLWAENDLPRMSADDRDDAEDWALECYQDLMFNVFNPSQKISLYQKYGWDVEYVRCALRNYYTDDVRRKELSDQTGVFRILAKTLIRSGIVTDRTRQIYAQFINIESLDFDNLNSVENSIAESGIALLAQLNSDRIN